jgi:hypothetical protein
LAKCHANLEEKQKELAQRTAELVQQKKRREEQELQRNRRVRIFSIVCITVVIHLKPVVLCYIHL